MVSQALRLALPFLLLAVLAAGCARPEIEQGNYLTRSQAAKVNKGMERSAVRAALGDPLLAHPFHPDRWDYIYTHIGEDGSQTRSRLTLYFNDSGSVSRIVRGGEPFPEGYSAEGS
ncbi:MAG TPA: outer membrane protein assembly factor BamE [Gammaproteobacteria bacterium]|nr:outer membrane protein assembly factor BamE [Gammaproteobacteria bacterium]